VNVLAFCLLAVLIVGYILLDGYDLGMGTLVLFVSRGEDERRAALASIGPYWNGNEVWLVAAGAALFALFPLAYASAFSGFYLPFMLVLWLLIGRGISFELRETVAHPLWHAFWDVIFTVCSALLIVLFGVALGNIIRGVPLNPDHYFAGTFGFLLNGYALAIALLALLALAQHGALYLRMRTRNGVAQRSRRVVVALFPAIVAVYVLVTVLSFATHVAGDGFRPAAWLGGLVAIVGLIVLRVNLDRLWGRPAFLGSSAFLVGMLISAAATIFPYLLPGFPQRGSGLDIYASAAPATALTTALVVLVVGLSLLAVYRTFLTRRLSRS
jgi:cytochrome bd ubiquinol oxidase subunit II